MIKILFVCTGNTCRSPMAEIILKQKLKWAGIKNVRVSSAGTNTVDGLPMNENSKKALKLLGIPYRTFKSKRINETLIEKSTYVICMTDAQKEYLKEFENVFTFNDLTGVGEILDPYGQGLDVYVRTSHQLEDGCNTLMKNIFGGLL
ncbi:MAG: low molecular weight protein arginine phosphatase [Clostridiales bacterium]|nr:low molecular weight protein arginine phosphatase [Clostridiales bacterium]